MPLHRQFLKSIPVFRLLLFFIGLGLFQACWAQPPENEKASEEPNGSEEQAAVKRGFLIDAPMPMTSASTTKLVDQLASIHRDAPDGIRVTVVLRYGGEPAPNSATPDSATPDSASGAETEFEDAVRLARAITSDQLRKVRIVSWVTSEVTGHSTLPILASDLLLMGPSGVLGDATTGEKSRDEMILLSYRSLARRRGLFPEAIVSALVDPTLELASVTEVGGRRSFASGKQLGELRSGGDLLSEEVWSPAGQPLRLTSEQLRAARIAAAVIPTTNQVAEFLDLAELSPLSQSRLAGEAKGALLEITGSIASNRSRRWQSNLNSSLSGGEVNTWMISLDSIGGSLESSATLAGWFAAPTPPLQTVAGFVRGEARGDSALIALSTRPLWLKPDSRIGGQGAQMITSEQLKVYDELIEQLAKSTNRSAGLVRGLLDPSLEVYRFTNRKTGRIRYATIEDIEFSAQSSEDPEAEREKWERGELMELAQGLTAAQAISLGLADGEASSLEQASRLSGLSGTPPPITDRGLVRLVERLGRSTGLSILLLFIGFAALSAEANAPGLSLPGFVALLCFALFFWMKFLAGTAEWFELLALSIGLICIAIEIFVVPGFGVFGVGGLALTVLGIVLMSQTFVVPQNVYQIKLFSRGVWGALAGAGGMAGGFLLIRMLFPHVPLMRDLIMEAPDGARLDESEKLGDYGYLLGQQGVSTTPLRPSGKALFGEQIVQVISDGSAIGSGEPVRVCEVHATRVIVEAVDS